MVKILSSESARVYKQIQIETEPLRLGRNPAEAQSPESRQVRQDQEKQRQFDTELQARLQAAEQEAERMMIEARQESISLLNEARQKVRQMEEQAYQEGLQRGEAEGQAKLEAALTHFQAVIQAALGQRADLLEQAEQELVHLVLEIVRRILKLEPIINEQVLTRVVQDALQRLGQRVDVHIYVNPEDVDLLHFSLNQIQDLALEIVIDPDPEVPLGSCRISSKAGEIDARLTTQFDAIARSYLALAEGHSDIDDLEHVHEESLS